LRRVPRKPTSARLRSLGWQPTFIINSKLQFRRWRDAWCPPGLGQQRPSGAYHRCAEVSKNVPLITRSASGLWIACAAKKGTTTRSIRVHQNIHCAAASQPG
jgi:hypothetical protein